MNGADRTAGRVLRRDRLRYGGDPVPPPGGVVGRVVSTAAETLDVDAERVAVAYDPPDGDAGNDATEGGDTEDDPGTAASGDPAAGEDDGADGADARHTLARLRAGPIGRVGLTYEWAVIADHGRDAVLVREEVRAPRWYPYGLAVAYACLGSLFAHVIAAGATPTGGAGGGVTVDGAFVLALGVGVAAGFAADLSVSLSARSVLARDRRADVDRSVAGYVPAYLLCGGLAAVGTAGALLGVPAAVPVASAGLTAGALGWLVAGDRALGVATRLSVETALPTPVGEYLVVVAGAAVPAGGVVVATALLPPGVAVTRWLAVAAAVLGLVTAGGVLVGPGQDLVTARGQFRAGDRYAGAVRTRLGLAAVATAVAYGGVWVAGRAWAAGAGLGGGEAAGGTALALGVRLAVLAPYATLAAGMAVGAAASVAAHRRRFRTADPAGFPAADAVDVPVAVTDGGLLDVVGYDDGRRRRVFVSREAVALLGGDDDRLRAVLAHEAAHVREGDALWAVWAPVVAPLLGLGGNVLLAALDFRARELRADQSAARATSPATLVAALEALAAEADEREVRGVVGGLTPVLPRATAGATADGDGDGDGAIDGTGATGESTGRPATPVERAVGRRGVFGLLFGGFAATDAHPSLAERTDRLVGERADGSGDPDR